MMTAVGMAGNVRDLDQALEWMCELTDLQPSLRVNVERTLYPALAHGVLPVT